MNSRLFSQYRIDIQKLIRIATPIGLAQLAQTGMGTVDVIMAGRVSSADVGGVGLVPLFGYLWYFSDKAYYSPCQQQFPI